MRSDGFWREITLPFKYDIPIIRVFQNISTETIYIVTGQYVEMRSNTQTGSNQNRKIFDQDRYYIDDSEIDWQLGKIIIKNWVDRMNYLGFQNIIQEKCSWLATTPRKAPPP